MGCIQYKKSGQYIQMLILFIAVMTFLLIFSRATSPLYPYYGGLDATVYIKMGQGILKGRVPYRDIYEMKGPLLFFIEALGQLICWGRNGAFIIQCINLFIIELFVWRIGKVIYGREDIIPGIALLGVLSFYVFEGGGLTEEFTLFFTTLAAYAFVMNREKHLSYKYAGLILGISAASISAIRINDSLAVIFIIVLNTIYVIKQDKKQLPKFLVSAIVGGAVIWFPLILYYCFQGAVADLWNGYFVTGIKYSRLESGFDTRFMSFIKAFPNVFTFLSVFAGGISIISLMAGRKSPFYFRVMVVIVAFMTIVAANISANMFRHYLIPIALPISLAIMVISRETREIQIVQKYYVILTVVALFIQASLTIYQKTDNDEKRLRWLSAYNNKMDIISHMENKDDIYMIDGSAEFYLYADALPAYRHFLMSLYVSIDPEEAQLFEKFLYERAPEYLITTASAEIETYDYLTQESRLYIEEMYELIYNNEAGYLFQHK